MNRRRFLIGAAGALVAGAVWARPKDAGGVYDAYFRSLNAELRRHGPHRPCLIVDLDRLEQNVKALTTGLNPRIDYRVVAKSLPCPKLIEAVMAAAGTRRLMVFHQPFVSEAAETFAQADLLLGKPMPVDAARVFYDRFKGTRGFDPARQLQWLVDTAARLDQYRALARQLGVRMRINVEIDVGLHRGGLSAPRELVPMLETIAADPGHLQLAGLMGYDPHVVKLPAIVKSADAAYAESQSAYRAFLDLLRKTDPAATPERLCINGAGSPTAAFHKAGTVINDLSAGSCLVKPVDFDIPTLADFVPAAFIATPVLKKLSATTLPAAESLKALMAWWNPNWQQSFFIYGGRWMARYESPAGLSDNPLYGVSTNQQMVNGSRRVALEVDDHIFLRPTQSEFVFLQFGDLLAVRKGRIVDRWPVFSQ